VLAAVEHLAVVPRSLTFVHAAAGGPAGGYRLLNDSNYDWGQGLIDLRAWMRHHGVERVHLAYFGSVDPRVYGIAYTPLVEPGDEPYVAVSSFYLVGLAHRMQTPRGRTGFVDVPFHAELERKTPVARAGPTIFVYTRRQVEEAIAELGASRGRLPA
jgi:hypothetical protein